MSWYGISDIARKKLIDYYKPKFDAMIDLRNKKSSISKTSLVFSGKKKKGEHLEISYRVRGKFWGTYTTTEPPENVFDILTIKLQTMPHCCGILVMSGGEHGFADVPGYGHIVRKDNVHPWTLFCELVCDFAKMAGYGQVIATDIGQRTEGIAKRLDAKVLYKFKNPRTENEVTIFLKHIQ